MTTNTHTPNPWNATSYGGITGSGARKLTSSRVAPLIALARGYWTVADKESAGTFAMLYRGAAGVQTIKNGLVRLVAPEDEDLLAMPWFSARAVADEGSAVKASVYQYRPSTPVYTEGGKPAKYKFFPNQPMVIDVHPATPIEWMESSGEVLVTEGLLKGDSALTAHLIAYGGADATEQLSKIRHDDGRVLTTDEARDSLQQLMLRVPAKARTVVASAASVTTWAGKDADWRKINLRDKRVVVAFDGDLADNANVWRETNNMFKFVRESKGAPVLLSLFGPEIATAQLAAGMDPDDKLGIDDYFDQIGDWKSLLDLANPQMPAKPKSDEVNAINGDWRIHPSNDAIAQEYVESTNANTGSVSGNWITRSRVGGRLVSTVASRRPTENEILNGVVDAGQQLLLEDSSCEVEIALLDRNQDIDDEPTTYRVFGPATLMAVDPRDWTRHAVQLPNEVLAHPDWPPRNGREWLGAIKANKRDQVETAVAWNTMGWVPVPDGQPAFIVGNQILAANEKDAKQTRLGVTERVLPGATKFGVIDDYDASDIEGYKAQVRKDITDVLQVFVENGFWRNRATAVAVLCAMYRPTIPKHPGTTLYFVGPKGAGKSYSASFIMRAWQQKPGTWTGTALPGSAGDTFGAHESSVSLAPIWIIDDLAPQSDRRKAEQQASDLENIIRAMFNNSAKRRLDGRTMGQREVANPIAMLAVTAENPPTVPSIQDRTLVFNVPKGAFNDTAEGGPAERWREKALVDLCDEDGAPARLSAAMIRFWHQDDTGFGGSWADRQDALERTWKEERENALTVLRDEHDIPAGEASRFVGQISSLGLTLSIMYELARWAGIDQSSSILDSLGGEDGYIRELYALAAEGITRARSTTPGSALLKALGGLLGTGKAHLRNATTPGAPPFSVRDGSADVGGVDVAGLNQALGWEYDLRQSTWVPRGDAIGYFGKKDDQEIALFETSAAFKAAQRVYPELIPHGQTAQQSWLSVYAEELALGKPARKDSLALRTTLGDSAGTDKVSQRISGIPVLAEKLFAAVHGADE
ncbi:hypothetical protein [Microbacterium sp. 77mftsu3.1]|uniref:hypothetical protein n=1 Tax=Microbacterium sp. 77mftsu3.1 TaxID=1761802 RepID=UPI0003786734|nr:hypothetical protein [Microbacterium sp. 77mftsu3.1]SDH34745.1 hypothetical protein SAMN04488590_3093 [Microbacterium sp. 77mftsu3.1]